MEINYLAVIAGGIAAWVIGSLWYSPLLFGKAWQKELGMTDDDLKGANMPLIFGTSLLLMIIMAFGIAPIIAAHGDDMAWHHGMFHGLMVGLMFIATSIGINYLYQRKSIKLFLIDAAYQILIVVIAGLIIGLWR
ncbi:DUF1761 domain-containing protein [Portibacter lacus]|uniref:DUF1761 domain-containing protein n=1 Tax=Portibacter lacus TaxID=1099794 RepID=A0AA37WGE3_9BACT|nr:DUF1761 domain-containing protein [Portibacter lacus]GLR17940.1 hypothetical protein GCM10007940_25550 [Portibacter lacus]